MPGADVQPACQCGAKRRGKGRMHPSLQKRRRGNARYNSPAHSGRRADRKKRADMARNGKLIGRGGLRRVSMAYFVPKKRMQFPPENEKAPHRLAAAGGWHCLIPVPAKRSEQAKSVAVAGGFSQFFFNPEKAVVFGHTVGTAQRAGLICPALVPTAMSAMVASSVSPERWEITAV